MTPKRKLLISCATFGLIAATAIPLSIVLTSCSNNKSSNPVLNLYDEYKTTINKLMPNQYGLSNPQQRQELINKLDDFISRFKVLQNQFNNKSLKLDINQEVWLKTILFDLEMTKQNYSLNLRYLGGDESNNENVYPCDAFNNYVTNNAQDAITVTNSNNQVTNQSVQTGIKKLNDYVQYLKNLQQNFEDGAKANIAQSIIVQRLFIANTIQTFYPDELNYWAQPSSTPANNTGWQTITTNELINGPQQAKPVEKTQEYESKQSEAPAITFKQTNYMEQNVKQVNDSKISESLKNEYSDASKKAQQQVNAFVKYFIDDYFANAIKSGSSYGFGGTTRPYLYKNENGVSNTETNGNNTASSQNTNKEVERTYSDTSGNNHLYGMGLTQQDLDTQKVGLSYMKSEQGSNIYDHLLKLSTTTDLTAKQIFDKGLSNTNNGVDNMKTLANAVVALETNNNKEYIDNNQGINIGKQKTNITDWKPIIAFDEDGVGSKPPVVQQLDFKYVDPNKKDENGNTSQWDNNWKNFNKWLNDENFFWGRELKPSQITNSSNSNENGKNQPTTTLGQSIFNDEDYKVLLASTTPSADSLKKYDITPDQWQQYKDVLTKTGYWAQWNVDGKMIGNISTKSALCGAITELRDYWKFVHNYAENYLNGRFTEKVADFKIMPYNYVDKDVAGVGASGGPNDNTFYLNVDPYSDLQKWSETSFTSHETFLGHRTQGEYVAEHPAKVNGKTGPVFSFTAYAEGWAVFIEWFDNQISTYGTVNPDGGIPLDFHGNKANGFVAGDINSGDTEGKTIKEFQNGVYWDAINRNNNFTLQDDKNGWSIATEIGNMLQYYGFLNEAQLRNMRQAVDTAYHGKFTLDSKDNTSTLKPGASIQEVRNYLHANSALGVGDVSNESIRYLAYPAQATSYMTGKDMMQQIYEKVNNQYKQAHDGKQIFEDEKAIKELFNVYLRNGDVPLSVLEQEVYQTYNIPMTDTPQN